MDAETWNARYREQELVWSAAPNQSVERWCADLPPGKVIDLAAGEGRNAIWLAERGWDATAVDYSAVAIDKARQIADRRGVTITTEVADLSSYVPTPRGYDLVLVAYLQLVDSELSPILERAAAAVAPGGRFFLINHDLANLAGGYGGPQSADVLTTPQQVVAAIGDELVIERAEVVERRVQTPDGERVALDTLVVAERVGSV
jgi:SAM-dependent methyltransferase